MNEEWTSVRARELVDAKNQIGVARMQWERRAVERVGLGRAFELCSRELRVHQVDCLEIAYATGRSNTSHLRVVAPTLT